MYTNLFFSHIFYKFLILILNWTAQITGLNWRKLIELLRNLKIKRRMSKKIKFFTVEDSLKSSPLCVRQWSSVFPSPPSSNPREVKKIQEDRLFFGSWGWKSLPKVYIMSSYHLWSLSIVLRKHVVHFNT